MISAPPITDSAGHVIAANLTPGNLIIQLRKLEDAGYLSTKKTGNGSTQKTTAALTSQGGQALDACRRALRVLLGGL